MNGSATAERTIVALGGNAFAAPDLPLTMEHQFEFASKVFQSMTPLLADQRELIITHGNGPQVGQMLIRAEQARKAAYPLSLDVCVAESQGELGYVISQSLQNRFSELGITRSIAPLLTRVVVAADDPAFHNPTKPVGPWYAAEQLDEIRQRGYPLVEVLGKGFRRVVASPQPREILEVDSINALLESGAVVIAAGGGGTPVIRQANQLKGIEAVIDKDLTSALLGILTDARLLLILTDVPCAYQDFNTPQQAPLGHLDITAARELLEQGHFAEGSMKPKIEAAIQFSSRPGTRTIICNREVLDQALSGQAGTIIELSRESTS
ncbi:Carbamate kinase 1 [Gimesia panareensis]|uniref:Carbamate kinase n=1 Tax=Gimesia panareensis TaxID=2527978 RepID=A0A518FTE4_9PLAN|nr:carbamate kinase [Gimesia panareensis]QDV19603.1 Carbamate kinase 1 [Gimesia panareensis]